MTIVRNVGRSDLWLQDPMQRLLVPLGVAPGVQRNTEIAGMQPQLRGNVCEDLGLSNIRLLDEECPEQPLGVLLPYTECGSATER